MYQCKARRVGVIRSRRANPPEYGIIGVPEIDFDFKDPALGVSAVGRHGVLPANGFATLGPVQVAPAALQFNGVVGFGYHASNIGVFRTSQQRTYLLQITVQRGTPLSLIWIHGSALASGFAFLCSPFANNWQLNYLGGDGLNGPFITNLPYDVPIDIILVRNGASALMVVEGRLIATHLFPGLFIPSADPFATVGDGLGGGLPLLGRIHRLMFWSRVPSNTQIAQFTKTLKKRF